MSTEAAKRALSASSETEDGVDKRQRMDEEMPAWAKSVFTDLLADVAHTKNNTNALVISVNDLKRELTHVKGEVEDLGVRVLRLELKSENTDKKIAELEEENSILKDRNDHLADQSMRDTLTIHHIPQRPQRNLE